MVIGKASGNGKKDRFAYLLTSTDRTGLHKTDTRDVPCFMTGEDVFDFSLFVTVEFNDDGPNTVESSTRIASPNDRFRFDCVRGSLR